jgi:hypothetical protein
VGRFKLKKLRESEIKKQYLIKLSNRFAALGNLNDMEENLSEQYEWKQPNNGLMKNVYNLEMQGSRLSALVTASEPE